jgi:hypothetical protein
LESETAIVEELAKGFHASGRRNSWLLKAVLTSEPYLRGYVQ